MVLFTSLYLALPASRVFGQECPAGFTPRLVVVNHSPEDIWMIETPPGSVSPLQAQWDWFKAMASDTMTLPNGGVAAAVLLRSKGTQQICVPDKALRAAISGSIWDARRTTQSRSITPDA